mgnify:CR=1 FL=1
MTVRELRRHIEKMCCLYFRFPPAWTGRDRVAKQLPALLLSLRNIQTAQFPHVEWRDGVEIYSYPTTALLEINLYTKGSCGESEKGKMGIRENTAVDDLAAFSLFLQSQAATELNVEADVAIVPNGTVTDVSSILDSGQNSYRAMAEFSVSFLQTTQDAVEVLDAKGCPVAAASDIRVEELMEKEAGYFMTVEIRERKEENAESD